jgi:hypothetical protein
MGSVQGARRTPSSAGVFIDRLESLYGLHSELESLRRVVEPFDPVPLETSVSLRAHVERELRLTLGLRPAPECPDTRAGLVAALSALGAEGMSAAVDEALASIAPAPERRGLERTLALRARQGEPVRPRPGGWIGGATVAERSARVANTMVRLGLDHAAAVYERLAAELAANPFNAVIPYGLGLDLGPDRVHGAKTYFACEWADVAAGFLDGLADELRLDGAEAFALLVASIRAESRRARWVMEVSFELPADPALGVRAKAYLQPWGLGSNEVEAHTAVLRLADQLALDPLPYEELVEAVRPGGLTPERTCSVTIGLSASARGPSLEVYLLGPARLRTC